MFVTISSRKFSRPPYEVPTICCHAAYNYKETLKQLHYQYDPNTRCWEIEIDPNRFSAMCAEVILACKLDRTQLYDFLLYVEAFQKSPKSEGYNMDFNDPELQAKYDAYLETLD